MTFHDYDPVKFQQRFWPDVNLYDKQREILYSIRDNNQTIVPAAHQMGKDFVAAFAVLWYFLTRNTVKVVTTSVKDDHLGVLWGEIGRFIDNCKYPLSCAQGGTLIINQREIRKLTDKNGEIDPNGVIDKISYVKGMVSLKGEGLTGHHAKHTLLVVDEASGVEQMVWERADTWASGGLNKKMFTFGNPYPCSNYFIKSVEKGDVRAENNSHYFRKVIHIQAADSPNVLFARAQIEAGKKVTNEEIVPGLVSYEGYLERDRDWDNIKKCIALYGKFYKGLENLMFPPVWLNRAEEVAITSTKVGRKVLGIDPGEGGADTCWVVITKSGIIELISKKTPDTTEIGEVTLYLLHKYSIKPEDVLFDRGGGGKQIADQLRKKGYKVRTVAFGESVNPEKKVGTTPLSIRKSQEEEHYIYKNRRAEMYHLTRLVIDPSESEVGFGIPKEYVELRRQLAPVPLIYDEEGRIKLPPKNKRDRNSTQETMIDLIGCSPDQSDALVLAVYGLVVKSRIPRIGALV